MRQCRVQMVYLNHDLDPQDRGPQDACGVFGVWAPSDEVAKLTYFGLYALQHRGQESAGIAVSRGSQIVVFKDMGLVSQVFNEATLESLAGGHLAIGHCRYSTTGASVWKNAQPTFRSTATGSIALGHNGNLTNTLELQTWLAERDDSTESLLPGALLHEATTDTSLVTRPDGDLPGAEHRRGSDAGAAAAARGLLPGLHGRGDPVRRPRPPGHPAAGARPARARLGGGQRDRRPGHRRRLLRPRGRSRGADRRGRQRSAQPDVRRRRSPRAACSSTSTSPDRTP